jgi:hypothetical protein
MVLTPTVMFVMKVMRRLLAFVPLNAMLISTVMSLESARIVSTTAILASTVLSV